MRLSDLLGSVRRGGLLIIVDDHNRENEGDFFVAGEMITPDIINVMATMGRGIICCCITGEIANRLELPLQIEPITSLHGTNFTVSIDAVSGVTTGTSAFDRAKTVARLSDPDARPEDFAKPGHIFPIIAAEGGLAERRGHTEAAIELVRLAGLYPVAAICEIMDDDGSMARGAKLEELSRGLNIEIVDVEEIVTLRYGGGNGNHH